MKCPKCDSEMNRTCVKHVALDRCDNCNAIWFDINELEEILKIKEATFVDLGVAKSVTNAKINEKIKCPKCDVNMLKMSYPGQAHIEVDHCGSCHGVLLDGGELTDIKNRTIGEYFSTLLKIIR